MTLVSVIMSVHNAELVILEQSVESIISQDYPNFEFIIINDINGSLVNNYLDYLPNKDPRICLISNSDNIGLTKSLIKGIKLSKGKYIARQDADDISFIDRLRIQVDYMENNADTSLIGSWYSTEYFHKEKISYCYSNNPKRLREKLFYDNPICHSSAMFSRYHYELINGYNPKYKTCQDLDLWFRLAKVGSIGIIEKLLIKRRILDGSLSVSSKRFNQVYNSFIIRLKNYQFNNTNIFTLFRIIKSFVFHLIISAISIRYTRRISKIINNIISKG